MVFQNLVDSVLSAKDQDFVYLVFFNKQEHTHHRQNKNGNSFCQGDLTAGFCLVIFVFIYHPTIKYC